MSVDRRLKILRYVSLVMLRVQKHTVRAACSGYLIGCISGNTRYQK